MSLNHPNKLHNCNSNHRKIGLPHVILSEKQRLSVPYVAGYMFKYLIAVTSFFTFSKATQQPWITVFVHGSVKAQWALCSLPKVMLGRINEQATYATAVRMARHDSIFNALQAMQDPGLKPVYPNGIATNLTPAQVGPNLITHVYDAVTHNAYPDHKNYYYTFGWSGLCSASSRYEEAKKLYQELIPVIATTTKDAGVAPRVRLIGFSHGGNVVLNLAAVREREKHLLPLQIDETLLLGMPVIPETAPLVSHPLFKKIYHFYSPGDAIQRSDFFSFKRFLSAGTLGTQPHTITQIKLSLIRYLDDTKHTRPMPPGHIEFWHLGWADFYRKHFPLYPLPLVTIMPHLIAAIQNATELGNHIQLTLHPQREFMVIKGSGKQKTLPFINKTLLAKLKKDATTHTPNAEYFTDAIEQSRQALSFARINRGGALIHNKLVGKNRYRKERRSMCVD
jgi:hypothetical protein